MATFPPELQAPWEILKQMGWGLHFSKSTHRGGEKCHPYSICLSMGEKNNAPSRKWPICLEIISSKHSQSIISHLCACHTNSFSVLEAQSWHLVRAQESREGSAA